MSLIDIFVTCQLLLTVLCSLIEMKNADQEGGEKRGERTVTPSDSQLNVWVSLVWEGERTSYSWPARLCAAESKTSEGVELILNVWMASADCCLYCGQIVWIV